MLSRLIEFSIQSACFSGIRMSRDCPVVSHLLFVDDSLLFMPTTDENIDSLLFVLHEYCSASGQMVNLQKSSVIFSQNTPLQIQEDVTSKLQIVRALNPGTYLGVLSLWNKTKCMAVGVIKDRILAKIKSWKGKLLNQGAREVLTKAVACSIPVYLMQCYKFPKKVCTEINSAMANFWWGQ